MIENEPKSEELSAIEDITEVRKREAPKDLIDTLSEYVPSIDSVRYPNLAQQIIDKTREAGVALESEIELVKKKITLLATLEVRGKLAETEDNSEFNFDKHIDRINLLIKIYKSNNPYEFFTSMLSRDELEDLMWKNKELSDSQDEFRITKKIFSLFYKRQEYRDRINSTQEIIRKILIEIITKEVSEILNIVGSAINNFNDVNRRLKELYIKFGLLNSEKTPEEIGFIVKEIQNGINFQFSARKNIDKLQGLKIFLELIKNECGGELFETVSKLISWVDRYDKSLKSPEYLFENQKKEISTTLGLEREVDDLKHKIERLFTNSQSIKDKKRDHIFWSITKEFLQAVREFNLIIKKANQITGVDVKEYNYFNFSQLRESVEISNGRLLTHTAPKDIMYQILSRGNLGSRVEQERIHGIKNHTHNHESEDVNKMESHSVFFSTDSIYSAPRHNPEIVLIFSENHILEKSQFVDNAGVAEVCVFKGDYHNDDDTSGFKVNLEETPFMVLVCEAEKEKMIEFLKQKSVFSNKLSKLTEEELQRWLDEYLMVIPDIRAPGLVFKEIKDKFFKSKKLKPRKGYVELTGVETRLKTNFHETKRFVISEA